MEETYNIPLKTLCDDFSFEMIYEPDNFDKILITTPEISRPGLALAGFYGIFDALRIQLIGNAEHRYLDGQTPENRKKKLHDFIGAHPIAILFTTNLSVYDEVYDYAYEFGVPVMRTKEKTSPVMAALIGSLSSYLAPRITRHGVLVEVYGEGLLLLGDSGVGKSETAIELVKRGHRLIADDAVEIKRVAANQLLGTAPEMIRHYVELRGIGIIDVRRLFGMGAVKENQNIDLVVNLEPWIQGKMYDRLGLDDQKVNILDVALPSITIPVKPGRNLSIILEVAAMNNRQKRMGYNTAAEFNKKLMGQMGIDE